MTDDLARRAGRDVSATPFESVALVLQGGGALGAYQGGVYQALAEADLHPDWVAGISIGAINSAIIAGNAPEKRVEKLREFWESVSASPLGRSVTPYHAVESNGSTERMHCSSTRSRASALMTGAPGFFLAALSAGLDAGRAAAGSDQLLRHRAAEGDAGAAGRFRPHQPRRDALQRRRGQRAQRQFRLFRHRRRTDRCPST